MKESPRFVEAPVTTGEFIAGRAHSGIAQQVSLQFGKCELAVNDLDVSSALIVIKKLRAMSKGELGAESVHFMANGVPIVCTRFFAVQCPAVPEWYVLRAGPVKISLECGAIDRFVDELSRLDAELRARL